MLFNKIRNLLLVIFLFSLSVSGQTKPNYVYYKFKLSDSSIIIGHIVFNNDDVIQIQTYTGDELRINKDNIIETTPVAHKEIEKLAKDPKAIEDLIETSKIDSSNIYRFVLKEGTALIGKIVVEDSTSVTLKLLSGPEINFNKETIKTRDIVTSKIEKGEYWIDDPNSTRLFFAPTGRGLKNNTGYFSVYEIFFPMVAFGVADFLTIAGGITLFPGSEQALYFAPKLTPFQNKDFAVSIGDFFVAFPNDNDNLNIIYSVATYSQKNFSFTAGLGIETIDKTPVLMIGAELRTSEYTKLITENWFFSDSEVQFLSLGIRFFGQHIAADFAFLTPWSGDADFHFFPWIGFAYNF